MIKIVKNEKGHSVIHVELVDREIAYATSVGEARETESRSSGRTHLAKMDPAEGMANDIFGAVGELAVAKGMNRYWFPGVNTFKTAGDVGDWEVRARRNHAHGLPIRPRDRDNSGGVFILVTGGLISWRIQGWIIGRDGMKDEWMKYYAGRPGAWFVEQEHLLDMAELGITPR